MLNQWSDNVRRMCYDADATPPAIAPLSTAEATAITLTSADGTGFAAHLARPAHPSGTGVLVLPDNRGLRGFYRHLTVRLAEQGHTALAIDYFGRSDGVNADRPEDFPVMEHLGRLTQDGLYGDFSAGIDLLHVECDSVVSLGFCLGGRFAFLTSADRFGLRGAIGFYGATQDVFGAPGPTRLAATLSAPILALFGEADEGIPAAERAAFDQALTDAGVPHEIVVYPGAPHGFFDTRSDFAEASADAWRRVLAFLAAPR